MPRKKKEQAEPKPRNGLRFVTWLLFGLLIVSAFVNVITILSVRGLRRTVNEMRDPVNNYFSRKLDVIETDLDRFVEIASEDGKSPYKGEVKKLHKEIEETREFWAKTSQATGARWVNLYWRAQRAQDETEQAWEELEARLSP
jgi:hypothetical protein